MENSAIFVLLQDAGTPVVSQRDTNTSVQNGLMKPTESNMDAVRTTSTFSVAVMVSNNHMLY